MAKWWFKLCINNVVCNLVLNSTVEPVYNGHPWLLYRDGLLIEVGGALRLY